MKTVSATEAKNRLATLIGEVASGAEDIVIENHGRPRAALISFETYRELLVVRDRQRRQEAMAALRALREEVRDQNQDLDDEAAEQLIDEIRSEVHARITARLRGQAAERYG